VWGPSHQYWYGAARGVAMKVQNPESLKLIATHCSNGVPQGGGYRCSGGVYTQKDTPHSYVGTANPKRQTGNFVARESCSQDVAITHQWLQNSPMDSGSGNQLDGYTIQLDGYTNWCQNAVVPFTRNPLVNFEPRI